MKFGDEVKGGSVIVKEFSSAPGALGYVAYDETRDETIASANLVPKFKDVYANKTSENLAYDIYVGKGRDKGLTTKLKDFDDRNLASEFMHQAFFKEVGKYAESKEMNVDWTNTYQHNRNRHLELVLPENTCLNTFQRQENGLTKPPKSVELVSSSQ